MIDEHVDADTDGLRPQTVEWSNVAEWDVEVRRPQASVSVTEYLLVRTATASAAAVAGGRGPPG